MIDSTLKLVKKGTGHRYFFSRLKNPLWIQPLTERGYFQSPPKIKHFDDGYVQFPSWSELQYLKNVAVDVPDQVVNLILHLPKVDNPSVYDDILEIALQLNGEHSTKLKPKILESVGIDFQLGVRRYADLLAYWTSEDQTSAALAFSDTLVQFMPDPQSRAKQKRRKENPRDLGVFLETSLKPSPQIAHRAYREMMSKGVCPLAEKESYQTAHLLTHATANMVRLRTHQEELNQGIDSSEIWYERLHELDTGHEAPDKTLVHTLIFACKQVYEKSPDSVVDLDKFLRSQQWGVFKRLRQLLYAQSPNEKTKPWIRELILEHEEYHLWEHRYEFQRMIRSACEHFGEKLLTEAERTQIFDAIRSGPSKANYRAWVEGLGEELTEERFQQHQRNFHRKQFNPFEPLLFGKYATDYQELEIEVNAPISDEDYPPLKTRGGYVSNRSPRSTEDLADFANEKLLIYINEWQENEFFSEGNSFVEIDIEGLAGAFQTVFKETIIPNSNKLRFWLENRERIERPIYVRMMIHAMQAEVKEKNFDKLNEWLAFSEWVLSHPDREHEQNYRLGRQGDESRENPDWYNSRMAINRFIEACIEEDVPLSARGQLTKILEMLCTQFDRHLNQNLNQNDLIGKGINSTRSRALEILVKFGFWLRRHDSESEAPEVTTILEKRFALQTDQPLTLPEHAILGRNYSWIFNLNKTWAKKHKSEFFPQDKLLEWLAAFSSFICSNNPHKVIFEIFLNDFDFALQHIADCEKQDHTQKESIDTLGQHLFTYYLWGLYPLKGLIETRNRYSLLERYYQVTNHDREHWANLFNYVGSHILPNTSGQLAKDWKDRIIAFFDWRFEVKESTELQQFSFWLEAECLEAEWRLEAYSKILEVCQLDDVSVAIQADTLCKMFPDHTAQVLECFVKVTDRRGDNNTYIQTNEAKTILKAGLNSSDERVRQNAERARENLLRKGRFELLNLDD